MLLSMLSLVLALQSPAQAPQAVPAAPAPRPARKIYNETADAKAQIADALQAAAADDIRVLINWGANDDEGCVKFLQALRTTPMSDAQQQVSTKLSNEYRVVYVDVGHLDKNQDLAARYQARLAGGSLPHFTILDRTGQVLAQKSAGDFAADNDAARFDVAKVLGALEKYQAPSPDAAPLFAAALKQAKAENKTLFVWFSAPW